MTTTNLSPVLYVAVEHELVLVNVIEEPLKRFAFEVLANSVPR